MYVTAKALRGPEGRVTQAPVVPLTLGRAARRMPALEVLVLVAQAGPVTMGLAVQHIVALEAPFIGGLVAPPTMVQEDQHFQVLAVHVTRVREVPAIRVPGDQAKTAPRYADDT